MVAILEQPPTYELIRYARDRGDGASLAQMKKDLGDARAIELERQYLGEAELTEIAAMALIQANRILVALNKPEIICWPKGWMDVPQSEYRLTTPLEVALDLRVYSTDDFWYLDTESSDLALSVAQEAGLDVYDEATSRVLTVRQAARRLDDEKYGPYEQFSVVLLEDLSLFLQHFCEQLYPELIEG